LALVGVLVFCVGFDFGLFAFGEVALLNSLCLLVVRRYWRHGSFGAPSALPMSMEEQQRLERGRDESD
jgi:hypothetical protein